MFTWERRNVLMLMNSCLLLLSPVLFWHSSYLLQFSSTWIAECLALNRVQMWGTKWRKKWGRIWIGLLSFSVCFISNPYSSILEYTHFSCFKKLFLFYLPFHLTTSLSFFFWCLLWTLCLQLPNNSTEKQQKAQALFSLI